MCTYAWRWKESWRYNIRDLLDGLVWYIFSILPLGNWARVKLRRVSITDHSFHTFIEWRRFLFLCDAVCFYPPPPLFYSLPLWYVLLSSLDINIYIFVLAFFVPSPLLGWYLKYVFQRIECWYLNKGGFGPLPLAILLHKVYFFDNEPSKRAQAMHLPNQYVWEGRHKKTKQHKNKIEYTLGS